MKRSFALLLTSLLLAVSLTACGKDRQVDDASGSTNDGALAGDAGAAGSTGSGGLTGDSAGSGVNGGVGNGGTGDSLTGSANNGGVNGSAGDTVTGGVNDGNGGSMMDGALDTMENAGDAARSAVRSAGNRLGGYTYEEMVHNGRVF